MASKTPDPAWLESREHSGHISLGPYSLFARVQGPPRTDASQAVVVIEAGLGSVSSEWSVVQRQAAEFARVYTYDRGGYGHSQPFAEASKPVTAASRAKELRKMLAAAGVAPPFVLVGHSYGSSIVRNFLAQNGKDEVVGMVIVDHSGAYFDLPSQLDDLAGDADFGAVVGLDDNHVLSADEWKQIADDTQASTAAFMAEAELARQSKNEIEAEGLVEKRALGDHRLSVVKGWMTGDITRIYEYGVKHGHGTEQLRQDVRKALVDFPKADEDGQRALLGLSTNSRWVEATGHWKNHNIHVTEPATISKEIKWVLGLGE